MKQECLLLFEQNTVKPGYSKAGAYNFLDDQIKIYLGSISNHELLWMFWDDLSMFKQSAIDELEENIFNQLLDTIDHEYKHRVLSNIEDYYILPEQQHYAMDKADLLLDHYLR